MFQFEEKMEQIKKRLDAKESLCIIDVRESDEYQQGHLPTAQLYALSTLNDTLHDLPKNEVVYVYCRSGQRANAAVRILQESGFHKVENIGGIIHWKYDFAK